MRNSLILLVACSLMSCVLGANLMWAYLNPSMRQALSEWVYGNCGEPGSNKDQITDDNKQTTNKTMPVAPKQKTTPPNTASEQQIEEIKNNGLIAKYTCQLAAYTNKVASFTVWLVLVTGVLAFVSLIGVYLSWRDTRIIQRAYISVEPGGIEAYAGGDDRIACNVLIHNAGNLPASHVSWFIDKKFSRNGAEPEEFFGIGRLEGDIVLAPKTRAKKGSKPTDQKTFHSYRHNSEPDKAWLFVFGKITYHDGFRDGRWITFCHRYNLRGATFYNIRAENGRYYEYANRTDESQANIASPDQRPSG